MKLVMTVLAVLASVLSAEAASNILTWSDNATNELNNIVERKAEPCAASTLSFAVVATLGPNVKTYTDTQILEGTDYCYRVAASNTAGKSAYSNVAGISVPFTIPAAPSGLGVTAGP